MSLPDEYPTDPQVLLAELADWKATMEAHLKRGTELMGRIDLLAATVETPADLIPAATDDAGRGPRKLFSRLLQEVNTPQRILNRNAELDDQLPDKIQATFSQTTGYFCEALKERIPQTAPPPKRLLGLGQGDHPQTLPSYREDPKEFTKFVKNHGTTERWSEPRTEKGSHGTKREVPYEFSMTYVRTGKDGRPRLVGYSVTDHHDGGNSNRTYTTESLHVVCDDSGTRQVRVRKPAQDGRDPIICVYELGERPTLSYGYVFYSRQDSVYTYDPESYAFKGNAAVSHEELPVDTFLKGLTNAARWAPEIQSVY